MTRCPAVDDLQCSLRPGHSGDHVDVVGHCWQQPVGEQDATPEPFPGWPADAPAVYVDADGEHDWDDEVPPEDDDDIAEPMTYRELAYDLASAQGLGIADFLERRRLRDPDGEKMSPSWIYDGNGYG